MTNIKYDSRTEGRVLQLVAKVIDTIREHPLRVMPSVTISATGGVKLTCMVEKNCEVQMCSYTEFNADDLDSYVKLLNFAAMETSEKEKDAGE